MISKSAENPLGCSQNLLFTCNARAAWGHIIESFGDLARPRILLPSYIGYTEREGSGVFDPVKKRDAIYEFYKLNDKLEINLDEFEKIIKEKTINIALIIHYFGFCQNQMQQIKQICHSNNVVLVEDCAHAFRLNFKDETVGTYGDYSFYSIHKFIATPSGGILKVNTNKINLRPLEDSQRASRDVLEQLIKTDLKRVTEIRRQNFASYKSFLVEHADFEPMYYLKTEDVPQTYPIRVKNSRRENLYFYLMENQIPTIALYYRLIDEIKENLYPESFRLSREILNLPVHQDITTGDIEIICKKINKYFTRSN